MTDSVPSPSSPRPAPPVPWTDRYVIDVARIVRDGSARSLSEVLISQVPGLLVVPGSGLAGAGARIRFAGVRTLLDEDQPLILLDGMRIDGAEDATAWGLGGPGPLRLDDIPVEDLESVEVVRGPASGAVFGPGAAAGVILITTKHGSSGAPRWDFFAQSAVRAFPTKWPTNYGGVDADNATPALQNGGCTLAAEAAGYCVQDYVRSFNPLVDRRPFGSPLQREIGFSGSGGPKWAAFRLSGNLEGDGAAYDAPSSPTSDDYIGRSLRASGVATPLQGLEIRGAVSLASNDLRLPRYGPTTTAVFGPSDSTGFTWAPYVQGSGTDGLARTTAMLEVRGHARSWLLLQGRTGLDEVDQREVSFAPTGWRSEGRRLSGHHTTALSVTAQNVTLGALGFTTTLGYERQRQGFEAALAIGPDSSPPVTAQVLITRVRSSAYYAVQEVAVRSRFAVTGALRRERFTYAPRFGGTHGSLAASWVARTDRPGPLGRVVLRAAYGTATPAYPAQWESFSIVYSPYPVRPLEPERIRAFEFGAAATLLGGRWRGDVTFYDMRSHSLFLASAQGPFGSSITLADGAVISNRGVAATLSGTLVDRPALAWDVRATVWGNRNRLAKLPYATYGTLWDIDWSGYPADGYVAQPIRSFADANGDGVIVASEVVRGAFTWTGTANPTQGFTLSSQWRVARRWHVSALFDYRGGQTLFNYMAWSRCLYRVCREVQDRTVPLADQARGAVSSSDPPTAFFEDADYLKWRELTVGFDVPENVARAVGARTATITLAARNLATWTGYSGGDPESGSYGFIGTTGLRTAADIGTVPPTRSFALRVRLAY